jgi:hypothetical protein
VVSIDSDATTLVNDSDSDCGKYRFHGKYLYLTYSQCALTEKAAFVDLFGKLLPEGARFFGGREEHKDGGINYHVVLALDKQVHWADARGRLALADDESGSLNISVLGPRQNVQQFLEDTRSHCEKDGDTFGLRIPLRNEASKEKKRKWDEIGEQSTKRAKLAKIKERFPKTFNRSFNNRKEAVLFEHDNEKPVDSFQMPSFIDQEFRIPPAVLSWEVDNLVKPSSGRPKSLLIVGDSRTGKSRLAQFIAARNGAFSEFDTEWNLDEYRGDQKCAVIHDMKKGFPYWRGVLGCQDRITVHGRYKGTTRLSWGVPSIWVCNDDNDPRLWNKGVKSYVERNCIVIEIRTRLY